MIGQTVGHYRIVDKLGEGGMGVVYKAEDTQLGRVVALKFLARHAMGDEESRARFLREARTAARLDHPRICTVHDTGEAGGQPYIVMPFVEGRTVRDKIGGRPMPLDEALDIAVQAGEGLAAAHAKGFVHRDVKSANLMVSPEGQVKVMDFGLAFASRESRLTKTGGMLGTASYMSPEQVQGKPLDRRTDIWSLGVVLYEMLTGRLPFEGEEGQPALFAIVNEPFEPVTGLRSGIPLELDRILAKALAKHPGERYQYIDDLLVDLRALRSGAQTVRRRALRWPRSAWAAGLLIIATAGMSYWLFYLRPGGWLGSPARTVSLAVLPFANLSGDPEQEYLSDGLTQEMISQLGGLNPAGLSVIARTSVMRYKNSDKPVEEVGRELNVDFVLEGSARREGDRIRITAELVRVRGQTQLWSETYEREMAGVLALQTEVSRKIAASLALRLLPAEKARLAHSRLVNPEAYEAYLQGLQHSYHLTPAGTETALRYFEAALEKDPEYAPAHAGVSFVWAFRRQMGYVAPAEALPRIRAAALKALELDEMMAEAHYSLAVNKAWGEWDWAGAELEFERAIELNPSFPDARAYYAHLLLVLQRPKEAVGQMALALDLDPFNVLFQSLHASQLMYLKQYDEAIAQARLALRAAPDQPLALSTLMQALDCSGRADELATAWKQDRATRGDAQAVAVFDEGYHEGGYREAWKRYAEHIAPRYARQQAKAIDLVYAYARAGEKELALDWLERAYDARDPNLPYFFIKPQFDGYRSEERFEALRRKMRLPVP